MRSALRRMGNSTGIIVPAPLLRAAGLSAGAELELAVQDGAIVATPVRKAVRAGWAESAAALATTAEEQDWLNAPLSEATDSAW